MSDLLAAALRYAEMGYRVFPCANDESPVPLTPHGFKDATTDAEQITVWWTQFPAACIGMATEGLLVVDVDGATNPWLTGERALELSVAPTARTPRGGWHYVFRKPSQADWRCSVGVLASNVDTRTDGGYIVVAPSVRKDGIYCWNAGSELDVPHDKLPEPPAWLAEALSREEPGPSMLSVPGDANKIPEGQRNSSLARLAGTMRRVGMTQIEIAAAIQQVNRDRCVPSLPTHEVERIAASISQYPPDQLNVALIEDHWAQLKAESEELPSSIIWFSDIEPTEVNWLWQDRIPFGRMSLLVGAPGKGKSLVTIDAAARVSSGMPWPDGHPCPMGSAILISAEDDPHDTIRPRLDAAGANVDKVGLLKMVKYKDEKGMVREVPFTLADIGELEKELKRLPDCKLVVIDPIGSFMGGNTDAHRDNEVRALLNPAVDLAQKLGFALIVVAHRRKGTAMVADDLALGSRAFTGMARAVWHVTPESDKSERRFMLPGKNNLAPEGHGLAFKIHGKPAAITWDESPVEMTADQGLAIEFNAMKPGPKSQVQTKASTWLKSALGQEPRLANDLYEEARELAGISKATLIRAKTDLGIDAFRNEVPGPWFWRWPVAKNSAEFSDKPAFASQA